MKLRGMPGNRVGDHEEREPCSVPLRPKPAQTGFVGRTSVSGPFLDFASLYISSQNLIRMLLKAPSTMTPVIQIGAVSMGPWSALKSLLPTSITSPYSMVSSIYCRTKILCVVNGFGGDHFVRLAESFGDLLAISELAFPFNSQIDLESVCAAARAMRPEIITAVHCEVATGMINGDEIMAGIGRIALELDALFVVDVISSAGCTAIDLERWNADLVCLGVEQFLGLPPVLSIVMVSDRAWCRIDQVKYYGYDSLLEWRYAFKNRDHAFPYKHWWPGVLELHKSLEHLLKEDNHVQRHMRARDFVIEKGFELGLELFVSSPSCSSPTGTVFKVPKGICASEFRGMLDSLYSLDIGDTFEFIGDEIFRIAHLGIEETDLGMLQNTMDAIKCTLDQLRANNRSKELS